MKATYFFGTLVFAGWLACCGDLPADPLNNWHWRNPLPNGNPSIGSNALYGIVFTNGTFFGVGASGTLATSTDGRFWLESPSATTDQLNDIIYAGGQFVAVGNNGAVETSSDGTNWVLQNSTVANSLNSVAYGNGTYAVVGSGVTITSADGVSWSRVISGLHGASAVAGNNTGFVAVDGSTNAYFSANGRNWTTNGFTVPVTGYVGSLLENQIVTATGTNFIIGSFIYVTSGSVDMFMFTSADGVHWTTNALGISYTGANYFGYECFINGGNGIIANGYADLVSFQQFSTNGGVTWSQASISIPDIFNHNAGVYGNGYYLMVGAFGVLFSPDSVTWTNLPYSSSLPVGPASTFSSIASNNGTNVVATSSSFVISTNDLIYTIASNTPSLSSVVAYGTGFVGVGPNGQIYFSPDGFSWTQHPSNTTNNLHGVAADNILLAAVGDNGTIQTYSPTGPLTWVTRSSGTTQALYSVDYSNGLFVAVGQQGTVVTSPDGITWTVRNSGVLSDLRSVTYGPAGFLAVGGNSTVLTSVDGVNWMQENPGVTASFYGASSGNGYYLIAGKGAIVMTSFDGVNWTPRNVGAIGGQTFYGSGFLNGRFDVVGAYGNILESDAVPQIFNLQIKSVPPNDVVTAFVAPGSTFRILSSTNLTSSTWTTAATFNDASAITLWTNSSPTRFTFYRLVSP